MPGTQRTTKPPTEPCGSTVSQDQPVALILSRQAPVVRADSSPGGSEGGRSPAWVGFLELTKPGPEGSMLHALLCFMTLQCGGNHEVERPTSSAHLGLSRSPRLVVGSAKCVAGARARARRCPRWTGRSSPRRKACTRQGGSDPGWWRHSRDFHVQKTPILPCP